MQVFLIIAIAVVVHASYIPNGFTWLDHNDIEQKRAVLPIEQIYKAFVTPFGETSFYRPLVTVANSVDSALYGSWAPGYHLTNVLLHVGVVLLTPLFLAVFFNVTRRERLWGMLIVGLHPASILVVGSTTQRQELLVTMLIMLTLIFYRRARVGGKRQDVIFTMAGLVGALSSKETALVLIPALVIVDEFFNKFSKKAGAKVWIIGAGIMAAYAVLRMKVVPKIWGTGWGELSIVEHIATRLGLAGKWVLLLASPFKPNFSDAVRMLDLTNGYVWIVIVLLAVVGVIIWRTGVRSNLGKAMLVTLILLTPGLNIIPVPRVGSPHYGYLPALGLAGIVVVLLGKLEKGRSLASIVLGVWLGIAAMTVFRAGFQFKNDETLFGPEVAEDQNFYEGHYYLGNYYVQKRNLDEAEREFELGLADNPAVLAFRNRWPMVVNLAGVKLEKGKLDEAEALYTSVEKEVPAGVKNYLRFNRAVIANEKKDYQEVVRLLSAGTWDSTEPYALLAHALQKLGREAEAKDVLSKTWSGH